MTIYKIANTPDQFGVDGNFFTTTSGRFDSNYTTQAMKVAQKGGNIHTTEFSEVAIGGDELWIHWEEKLSDNNNFDGFSHSFNDVNRVEVCELDVINGDRRLSRDGVGTSALLVNTSQLAIIDIHFDKSDATNYVIRMYEDSILVGSITFAKGSVNLPTNINWRGFDAEESYVSQLIVADEDTRGWHLRTDNITGDGFHTDGVGGGSLLTPSDRLNNHIFTAASQRTSGLVSYGGPTLSSIKQVSIGYIAYPSPVSTFETVTPFFRLGGTDYDGTAHNTLGIPSYQEEHFVNNPADAAAWDFADINSSFDIGMKT